MARILVVTDSTCDLPPEWIQRYDIRVVPTYVQFGDESLADDGVQLIRSEFYRRLQSDPGLPTTAAGPLGETVEVMAAALAEAEHVIALTAATELSAIYNTFRLATEQTDPARVTLIDSRITTMGLGWQVMIAAEMIADGADATAIEARLRDVQPRTDVWAALDTLENLRRSGRINWAAAMMGNWFQIKPIVRLHDGVVSSYTRVRTSHRAFDTLVEIAHEAAPLERLAVLHTNNLAAAQRLKDALADIRPDAADIIIVDVTPVIGLHVGANGLGLGLVRKTL